jgi:LPXTG-motif cell wall-anchored protein
MIRIKLALATLLLSGLALAPVSPAAAGGGPSDYVNCLVTVEPSTFAAGATVTVRGTGFQPNFSTRIDFNSVTVEIGSVTTDAAGNFQLQVTIPNDAVPGPHTISCNCDAEGNISSTDVTVSSTNATTTTTTGGGPLPRTGTDSKPLLVVGAIAVLVGIALVLVSKRRRRSAADH